MIDWKFKQDAEPQGPSDGLWYDIANGCIEPEKVLKNEEQIKMVWEALEILQAFENALKDNDLLIEF